MAPKYGTCPRYRNGVHHGKVKKSTKRSVSAEYNEFDVVCDCGLKLTTQRIPKSRADKKPHRRSRPKHEKKPDR